MTAYIGCGILIVLPLSAHPDCNKIPTTCKAACSTKSQLQNPGWSMCQPQKPRPFCCWAGQPKRPLDSSDNSPPTSGATAQQTQPSLQADAQVFCQLPADRQWEHGSVHRISLCSKARKSCFRNAGRKKFHCGKRRSWQRKTMQECKGNMETNGVQGSSTTQFIPLVCL